MSVFEPTSSETVGLGFANTSTPSPQEIFSLKERELAIEFVKTLNAGGRGSSAENIVNCAVKEIEFLREKFGVVVIT